MKKTLNLSLDIGADPVQAPAPPSPPAPAPEPEAQKRGPGRPPIPPRAGAKRTAVTVDDATYRRVTHACVDLGIDRQRFLEHVIELMFERSSK